MSKKERNIDQDEDYRKVLKDLGVEKPKDEPLTSFEFGWIFIRMQESLFVGY